MRLEIYKKDQGRLARYIAGGGLGLLMAFGCYRLYWWLEGFTWSNSPLVGEDVIGFRISVAVLIALAAFIASAVGIFYFLNRQDAADLLIDTETEMKKVTWPTKEEAVNSSLVVITCVVVMALLITAFDIFLRQVFALVGIG